MAAYDDGACGLGAGFREVRPRLATLEPVPALYVEAGEPRQIGALLSAVAGCVPRASLERVGHLKRVVKGDADEAGVQGRGGGHGVTKVLVCLREDYDAMDAEGRAAMGTWLPPLNACEVPREGAHTVAQHREWSLLWPLAIKAGPGAGFARQSNDAEELWEAFEVAQRRGRERRGGGRARAGGAKGAADYPGVVVALRKEEEEEEEEEEEGEEKVEEKEEEEEEEGPPGERVAELLLPDAGERRMVRAGMRLALSLAREARRLGRPGVGAVLYDRARGEIASCSGDRTTRRTAHAIGAEAGVFAGADPGDGAAAAAATAVGHPLGHAVMACIGASAAKYHVFPGSDAPLGPGEQPRAKRLKNCGLSASDLRTEGRGANALIRSVQDQYVCTGFDVFLSHEPCPMCAMALVHSRVARVFYAHPYPACGALGSVHALHTIKSLNHSFTVFAGVLAGHEDAADLRVP